MGRQHNRLEATDRRIRMVLLVYDNINDTLAIISGVLTNP